MPFLSPSPPTASPADAPTETSANTKSLPSSAVLIRPLDHPREPVSAVADADADADAEAALALALALATDIPLTSEAAVEVFLRSFFRLRLRSLNNSKMRFLSSDPNEG